MSRYWASFVCTAEDYRPLTYPPNDRILGWWCSGYTPSQFDDDDEEYAVLCLAIDAADEAGAVDAVLEDWPAFSDNGCEWRFLEERPDEWRPGDRFPLAPWMTERFETKGTTP